MWLLKASVLTLSLLLCPDTRTASQGRQPRSERQRDVIEEMRREFGREAAAQRAWWRLIKAIEGGRWRLARRHVGREVKFRAAVQAWEERSLRLLDNTQINGGTALRVLAVLDGPIERHTADSVTVEVLGKVESIDGITREVKVRAMRVQVVAAE